MIALYGRTPFSMTFHISITKLLPFTLLLSSITRYKFFVLALAPSRETTHELLYDAKGLVAQFKSPSPAVSMTTGAGSTCSVTSFLSLAVSMRTGAGST